MRWILKSAVPCWILSSFVFLSVAFSAPEDQRRAISRFESENPGIRIHMDGARITRIYQHKFGSGANPIDAAEKFRKGNAQLFDIDSEEISPLKFHLDKDNTQLLGYDRQTDTFKFTLVYYSQYRDNYPVYMAELRLLVRNEADYPLVLASSSIRDIGDFHVDPAIAAIHPSSVQKAFSASNPQYTEYTEPQHVIWAGLDGDNIAPVLGTYFVASSTTPAIEKYRFIIDPRTNRVLYQENLIINEDVTGYVGGYATEDFKAEQCGDEILTAMPWARVYIEGGNLAYANAAGDFVIPNSGIDPVTVVSYIRGRWFQVWNNAGDESFLSQQVTPPGPANFFHNPQNTEYNRAEVNGYVQANIVRDYTLGFNSEYPTIWNQYDFPVYVNRNDGYCPGNAWYDGSSINFCSAGGGHPNTAFSTVVHHEYGHHLVACAGSGQGAYGEGMGDVMGLLITDSPYGGVGFYGDCDTYVRNADNDMQYPCSGEIHYCGQLLSGCVWSTRNQLAVTNPSTYLNILSPIAIDAMLLHTGNQITPDITEDFLTIDDDDYNLSNGTPHSGEILAGFGAHNMLWPDVPPTIIGGNMNGVLSLANSPYYLAENVTVPSGQSLSIEAGVEIRFPPGRKFIAQGILSANATTSDPIRFVGVGHSGSVMVLKADLEMQNSGVFVVYPPPGRLVNNSEQKPISENNSSIR